MLRKLRLRQKHGFLIKKDVSFKDTSTDHINKRFKIIE